MPSFESEFRVPWWLTPWKLISFLLAPLFLVATTKATVQFSVVDQAVNYIDAGAIGVGLASMLILAVAAFIGDALPPHPRQRVLNPIRAERALYVLGMVTVGAYLVFFQALLTNWSTVLAVFQGQRGASAALSTSLARIPGVTSLVQLGVVFASLFSVSVHVYWLQPTKRAKLLWRLIIILTCLRGFLANERLAILEMAVVYGVVPLVIRLRRVRLSPLLPYLGIFAVFCLFASAEYFRSWPAYRDYYDGYLSFVVDRFFAYFTTSINNGAGLVETHMLSGAPMLTTEALRKFPLIGPIILPTRAVVGDFLASYGNAEFNNPGGLYAAFVDYGFVGGFFFLSIIGLISGIFYRKFRRGEILGLLIYPVWILGFLDLIRIFYWTSSRAFPVIVFIFIITAYVDRGGRRV